MLMHHRGVLNNMVKPQVRQAPTTHEMYHLLCSTHVASVVQMTHMLVHHGGENNIKTEAQVSAMY